MQVFSSYLTSVLSLLHASLTVNSASSLLFPIFLYYCVWTNLALILSAILARFFARGDREKSQFRTFISTAPARRVAIRPLATYVLSGHSAMTLRTINDLCLAGVDRAPTESCFRNNEANEVDLQPGDLLAA